MKVVAFQTKDVALVRMSMEELRNITGMSSYDDFRKKFAIEDLHYGDAENEKSKKDVMSKEFSVCDLFKDARDTLTAYDDIRRDLQSATARMTKLTEKMIDIAPKSDKK